MFHGFCMALADSVPGVSGGTIAFLMGFFDDFIGSLNDLLMGKMDAKKKALTYLVKLGAGWVIGFGASVLVLTAVFESHIYAISSLFIGFILFAIPVVIMEEKKCMLPLFSGLIISSGLKMEIFIRLTKLMSRTFKECLTISP